MRNFTATWQLKVLKIVYCIALFSIELCDIFLTDTKFANHITD